MGVVEGVGVEVAEGVGAKLGPRTGGGMSVAVGELDTAAITEGAGVGLITGLAVAIGGGVGVGNTVRETIGQRNPMTLSQLPSPLTRPKTLRLMQLP